MKWTPIALFVGIVAVVLFFGSQYYSKYEEERLNNLVDELEVQQPSDVVSQPIVENLNTNTEVSVDNQVTSETPQDTATPQSGALPDFIVDLFPNQRQIYSKGTAISYSLRTLDSSVPNGTSVRLWARLKSSGGTYYEIYNDNVIIDRGGLVGKYDSFSSAFVGKNLPEPGTYTLELIINPSKTLSESDYSNNTVMSSIVVLPGQLGANLSNLWGSLSKGTNLASYAWGVSGDDDYYDGGGDVDTLEYYGLRSEHEVVRSPLSPAGTNNVLLIRKKIDDSLDIVVNIEIIVFKDQTVLVSDLF